MIQLEWKWKKTPDKSGYYFMGTYEDWDLSKAISVERVENPSEIYFRAYINGKGWLRTTHEYFDSMIWLGPVPKLFRPPEGL